MEINTSRGKLANASANSSRAMSVHSSVSSITYVERMEAQNKNSSWADQVEEQETDNLQRLMLYYANSEVGDNTTYNEATDVENMLIPNSKSINNIDMDIYHLHGLKSSFIPWKINQANQTLGTVLHL